MARSTLRSLALAGAVLLLASACTGGDAAGPDGDEPATATDLGEKPEVDVGGAADAEALVTDDLVVGDGEEAGEGDDVTVHYVGVAASNGEQFDASWDRDEPLTFTLGAGMVIPGWEEGVDGMRVGGRRQLTIPPDMAYGERGVPGAIGPDETLVFVVDLLEVS